MIILKNIKDGSIKNHMEVAEDISIEKHQLLARQCQKFLLKKFGILCDIEIYGG